MQSLDSVRGPDSRFTSCTPVPTPRTGTPLLSCAACRHVEARQPQAPLVGGINYRESYQAGRSLQMKAVAAPESTPPAQQSYSREAATLLCTIATAPSISGACEEIRRAEQAGATAVELRLDFYEDFDAKSPAAQLQQLLDSCRAARLPSICTCRPHWEGGRYQGDEAVRLDVLRLAARMGAQHVDVELKAAAAFFDDYDKHAAPNCKIILSSHNFRSTPSDEELSVLLHSMHAAGADIPKVATTAQDITDSLRMLSLLQASPAPTILLAMGERGLITRLLAPKYGGYLTFGSLASGKESALGQPTIEQLLTLFRLPSQQHDTKVYGIVGNPVGHSKSPLLHNAGFRALGYNAVYVPLLIDDLASFLAHPRAQDFAGLSVTIPHKEAALQAADQVDPTAGQIGAVNTLTRSVPGKISAFNTDWSAAIAAIEDGMRRSKGSEASTSRGDSSAAANDSSPLKGRRVVVLGAGGSARALVFGALTAGARVTIVNRSRHRAEALAEQAGGKPEVADLQQLLSGSVTGDVLINVTSVGMHPRTQDTPVPDKAALQGFTLVFDAIYTPMVTQLLKDAKEAGCITVSGVEMFVGQALQQFVLFTSQQAPAGLFRQLILESLRR